jgi:hypothetical protein
LSLNVLVVARKLPAEIKKNKEEQLKSWQLSFDKETGACNDGKSTWWGQ